MKVNIFIFRGENTMKLKKKMLLFIMGPVFLVIITFSLVSYFYSNNFLLEDAKKLMNAEASYYGTKLESILVQKTTYVDASTHSIENSIGNDADMLSYLTYLSNHVKGTLGFYVGFQDKKYLDGTGWIPDSGFDPTTRVWYTSAMENSSVALSPPYLNASDNTLIITLSKKLMKNNAPVGVVSNDISMNEFSELVNSITIKESGKAYLLNQRGNFLLHPQYGLNDNIDSVDGGAFSKLKDFLTSSSSTTFRYKAQGVEKLYAKYNIAGSDWILLLDAPTSEILAASNTLGIFMMILGLVSLILLALIIYWNAVSIVKPILMLTSCIEGMVAYDFTLTEKSPSVIFSKNKDEIGTISRALIKVKNTVKDILVNINDIANQVSASSEELSASSDQSASLAEGVAMAVHDISEGVIHQTDSMTSGNRAMEIMEEALSDNEKVIEALNTETRSVLLAKENGISTISQLVEATETSKKSAIKISGVIEGTNEKAIAISAASDMIKSIADQTNLLALNAAIEAARAGEAGKGFAVVAEEIRKLAEQSNSFTEEIKDIVNDLTSKTSEAVSIMATVGEMVGRQTQKVDETKEQFDIISNAIDSNRKEIEKLNKSKEKLLETKESLSHIIHTLSDLTNNNAESARIAAESTGRQTASSQEVASASLGLAEMSQDMINMISKFKIN